MNGSIHRGIDYSDFHHNNINRTGKTGYNLKKQKTQAIHKHLSDKVKLGLQFIEPGKYVIGTWDKVILIDYYGIHSNNVNKDFIIILLF
jgi:hypothetical protein